MRQGVKLHALSLTLPMVHWRRRSAERVWHGSSTTRCRRRTRPIRTASSAARRCRYRTRRSRVQEIERVSKLSGIRGVYLPTSLPTRRAVGSIAPAGVRALRGIEYAGAAAPRLGYRRRASTGFLSAKPARQSVRHGGCRGLSRIRRRPRSISAPRCRFAARGRRAAVPVRPPRTWTRGAGRKPKRPSGRSASTCTGSTTTRLATRRSSSSFSSTWSVPIA